jgi:hypothetical protein
MKVKCAFFTHTAGSHLLAHATTRYWFRPLVPESKVWPIHQHPRARDLSDQRSECLTKTPVVVQGHGELLQPHADEQNHSLTVRYHHDN